VIDKTTVNEKILARKGFAPGAYHNFCVSCEILYVGDKRSSTCHICAHEDWKPTHRHIKNGDLYMFKDYAMIEKDWTKGALYEDVAGQLIVRPITEFFDKRRFESL
jgi:hypothetical protein